MNPYELFKNRLGDRLKNSVLASPLTYRLARRIFLRRENFDLKALQQLADMGLKQAADAYSGKRPVVWCTAFFPDELLHALGFVPFAPEVGSALISSLGLASGALSRAEQLGLAVDTCSFHRCAAGGMEQDYFPAPDLMVASTHLCDGAPQLFRLMSRRRQVPYLLLDAPNRAGGGAEAYVAKQLERITWELERIAGRKLDQEAIAKAFAHSNRGRREQIRVNDLRRKLPGVVPGEQALSFLYLTFLGQGHPRTASIYRSLAAEIEERERGKKVAGESSSGEGSERENSGPGGSANPRLRLLWLHLKPYYPTQIFALMRENFGAEIIFEEMSRVYWPELDPGRPFLSLARKVMSHPQLGPAERRLQAVKQMVEDYRVDGVVHFSHWGCRQAVGATSYLHRKLRSAGIPFLSLDADCVDPGNFSSGQIRTRLESFLEMIAGQIGA